MGGIIGIGIFFTPHKVARLVSEPWAFICVWVICGFVAMCAAFTFAELGATFPKTGGWFVYLREAFGRFPAFLFAWVVLAVVSTGATAGVAKFGVGMLHTAFPRFVPSTPSVGGTVAAIALILAITGIGLAGVKRAAFVQNLSMLIKLLAILALVVCGYVIWSAADASLAGSSSEIAGASATHSTPSLLQGVLSALLPVFFAYGGWQMIGYIAPEVKEPTRTIPRAIVLGVLGVIIVYVLVNLAFVGALGIEGIAADDRFAARMARGAIGESGERVLAAGMAISALGWCVVSIITAPWLYVAMAREGLFFRRLGELHPVRGVPTAALLLQAVVMSVYLVATDLDYLVGAVVFAEWFFHGLVAIALIRLRMKAPKLPRPYTSPLYPLAPVVYVLAATVVLGHALVNEDPRVTGLGLAVIAAGAIVFAVWSRVIDSSRTRA